MKNIINWFEIPVKDFERARKFYSTVFNVEMPVQEMIGHMMAFFPMGDGAVSGCIVYGMDYEPSENGPLIYFDAGPDLGEALSQIPAAGGRVLMAKTLITDEIGYIATFLDTEGNKLALHSKQ